MMIKIEQFDGIAEKLSPRLLDSRFATKAMNCRVDRGFLEPMRGRALVQTLPISPQTIYRYEGNNWFTFSQDVDVARAPTAYDNTRRVVYTGTGYPRQTRNDIAGGAGVLPANSYRLGVPAPTAAPSAGLVGTPPADSDPSLATLVYYVVCYVTAWGEEGPPSPPSPPIERVDEHQVDISLPPVPTGNYNWGTGALMRIYRSNSGTSATAFQFLIDVPISATVYSDVTPSDALGEVIPSTLWGPPPDDNTARFPSGQLQGVRTLASGAMVGFSGNTLVYSVPYLPHAWAAFYPLKDDIVAIEVTSTGVLVATVDRPVVAQGLDPQAVFIQELDVRQSCVSKRSMVDMGEYAIYASPDGLVGIENGSATLLTKSLLTRDQWQRYKPEEISAYRWEDKYIAFHSTGGFIFAPGEESGVLTEFSTLAGGACGYYDGSDDTLYVASGNQLYKFGEGDPLNYTWESKVFQLPHPATFSVLQVLADTYPVAVDVIRDGTRVDSYSVPSDKPVRMQTDRTHTWQIRLTGTNTVHSIAIAQSMEEIASG